MRKSILLIAFFIVLPLMVKAQKDITKDKISTWMFQVSYSYQFPGMDTKTLYGENNTIGGGVYYKTDKNWMFSFNGNFRYRTFI